MEVVFQYKSWLWRKLCGLLSDRFFRFHPRFNKHSLCGTFCNLSGSHVSQEKGYSWFNFVCYSDSLHCINLTKGPSMRFHIYAVLIQDLKELLDHMNVTIYHTLREGNQCANFMAKIGASLHIDLCHHTSPLESLRSLLRIDAAGTIFSRELFVLFFLLFLLLSLLTFVTKRNISHYTKRINHYKYLLIGHISHYMKRINLSIASLF